MSDGIKLAVDRAFTKVANVIAAWAGSPEGFALALLSMVVWAALGPVVGYSEIWQLSVNTGTTIVTFLMVFIIQNSQNRDTRAIQIKIDELIRATRGASNSLLDLEILSSSEIEELHKRYCAIAERAKALGYDFDTGSPDLPSAEALDRVEDKMEKAEKKPEEEKAAPRRTKKPRKRPAASAV
jgi:low affinity Fe/Cu permease